MELDDRTQAWRALVHDGPLPEELVTLLPDGCVDEVVTWQRAQTLKQGLVGKSALETTAGVLNEAIEDGEGAQLAVTATVLPVRVSERSAAGPGWK